jgi:hypothetical protein
MEMYNDLENVFEDWKDEGLESIEADMETADEFRIEFLQQQYDELDSVDFEVVKFEKRQYDEDLLEKLDECLEDMNEYDIDRDEFLDMIYDFSGSRYAEIAYVSKDTDEIVDEFLDSMGYDDLPSIIMSNLDYDGIWNDLRHDRQYIELDDGRIVVLSL